MSSRRQTPGALEPGTRAARRAFTLIELIVVVIIIGVLASISAVAFNSYVGKAKDTAARANLSQVLKKASVTLISSDAPDEANPAAIQAALQAALTEANLQALGSVTSTQPTTLAATPVTLTTAASTSGSKISFDITPSTSSDSGDFTIGLALESGRDHCSMASAVGASVTSWTVTKDLGGNCLGEVAVQGETVANGAAYADPSQAPATDITGLNATAGDTQVALTWSPVTGASGYNVYRGTTKVASPSAASFTDTGRTNGTAYSYQVAAVVNGKEKTKSTTVSATPQLAAPAAPTLAGSASSGKVVLSWNAPANATSYKVFRNGTLLVALGNVTSYTNTGLTNGTSYSYTVTALNGTVESVLSNTVTTTPVNVPAAPTSLAGVAGATQIALTWNASSGATSYSLYRGGILLAALGNVTSYTNSGLTGGTSYSYTVTSTGPGGESTSSNTANLTTWSTPGAPTAVTATNGADTQSVISWAAPASNGGTAITGYTVTSTPGGKTCTTTGALTCTVATLTNGTAYTFSVTATNALGTSTASSASNSVTPTGVAVPTGVVTTFAGSGAAGAVDGTGTGAQLNDPISLALAPDGTMYVADRGNDKIRKITPSGVVTTFATGFSNVVGVGVSPDGATIYVSNSGTAAVKKITAAGAVSTLAGGTSGFQDGTGSAAKFGSLAQIAVGPTGTVYVADTSNNRIRAITPAGDVTTLAGQTTAGFADGTGSAAKLWNPRGLAISADGTLYVADDGNNRIRAITPAGVVTTLAGQTTAGFADATGSAAQFSSPRGVAVSASGIVYVADSGNQRIRAITPAGVVTTLAGQTTAGFADATGSAAKFSFTYSYGVAVAADGAVFVADQGNNRVRKVS